MKTSLKIFILSFLILNLPALLNAQQQTFAKVIYYGSELGGNSIVKTYDNYYLIAGVKDQEALVLKMDSAGNIIWSKQIGNLNNEIFSSIIATRDSCFVLVGNIFNTADSTNDILCVKLNTDGDTLWTKEIDMGYNDYALSVQQTYDNGYILAGYASQDSTPLSMAVVVKLDAAGNLMWGRIFSQGNYLNCAYSVKQTPDSGYVVIGYVYSLSIYDQKTFLMKLTSTGNITWIKKHNISSYDQSSGFDVKVTTTGFVSYLLGDYYGTIIMKTDFSGNILWCKNYNVGGLIFFYSSSAPALHSTSDNGYVLASGNSFLKIDSVGNPVLAQDFFIGFTIAAVEARDKGFMILGNGPKLVTKTSKRSLWEIGIIKTDSLGNTSDCVSGVYVTSNTYPIDMVSASFVSATVGTMKLPHPVVVDALLYERNGCVDVVGSIEEIKADGNAIIVNPNPTTGIFQIKAQPTGNAKLKGIDIYNTLGKKIFHSANPMALQSQIDLSSQPDGIYFIQLLLGDKISSERIIICH